MRNIVLGLSLCVLAVGLAPAGAQSGSSSLDPGAPGAGPVAEVPGPGGLPEGVGGSLMWVVENQSDQVFVVDVNALTATLVGPAGLDVVFGGLGFDPFSSELYCWNTNPGNLYRVDQTTGAFTLIGGSALFGADTFDIRPTDGTAIAWSVNEELHDVDLATGGTTLRVATTGSGVASAFAPDGTYYNLDRGDDTLYTVDVDTGARTAVGPLGINVESTNVAFNPDDGFLYAIEIQNINYPLYRIDPATGAATVVGNVTGLPANEDQQITMATFLVAGFQPPLIQEIPTLSTAGLAGLALLLAASLVWVARRRLRA